MMNFSESIKESKLSLNEGSNSITRCARKPAHRAHLVIEYNPSNPKII